jgi:hypothetical protein
MRREEYFDLVRGFKQFLLIEGRFEDVARVYPEDYKWLVSDFASADPSGNLKYLDWMMEEWWNVTEREKDPYQSFKADDENIMREIINAVEIFHTNIQRMPKKDINSWSYSELMEFLIDLPPSKTELRDAAKKTIKIFENDEVQVLIPLTKQASCAYGADTAWCISGRSGNRWDEYTLGRKDFFVFVKDKKEPRRTTFSKVSVQFKWDGHEYRKIYWTSGDRSFYPQDEPEWKWASLISKMEKEIIATYKKHLDDWKNNLKETLTAQGRTSQETFIRLAYEAYKAGKHGSPEIISSYNALKASNDKLFKRMISKISVEFVKDYEKNGYTDANDMVDRLERDGKLKIDTRFSNHEFFSPEENWVFRAVHDYYTHNLAGKNFPHAYNFDMKGELQTYNTHAKIAPRNALPALFSEVVGQLSFELTTGQFPDPQKSVLMYGFDFYNPGVIVFGNNKNKKPAKYSIGTYDDNFPNRNAKAYFEKQNNSEALKALEYYGNNN